MRVTIAFALALCALFPFPLHATAAPSCSSRLHRQFDFWAGAWKAYDRKSGKYLGTDVVVVEMGGCVLHERWSASTGSWGESLNGFDEARGVWHQSWMDDSGHVILFDGGLSNGTMTLIAKGKDSTGRAVLNRLRYEPLPQHRLHVTYATSDAKTGAWKNAFDGVYRPI